MDRINRMLQAAQGIGMGGGAPGGVSHYDHALIVAMFPSGSSSGCLDKLLFEDDISFHFNV